MLQGLFSRVALVLLLSVSFALSADEVLILEDNRNVDPWEPLNRKIFGFNEGIDRYLLRPVAHGYRLITPDPVETGVTNFLSNIYEFNTIVNSILQGRAGDVVHTTGRLLINTTIGVGGLLDVASGMGVEKRPADFGQTLSVWGVDAGPYLMLPVIGPRTMRGTAGYVFDSYSSLPYLTDDSEIIWSFNGVEAIDVRAQLLRADELISGDKYIFVRNAYLQQREYFLSGGEIDDSFSDYEEGEDFEDF